MAMYSQGSTGGLGELTTLALLDQLEPDRSTVALSHFVEWFSGTDLDSVWTQTNQNGVGTFNMVDDINEGFQIQTGTALSNDSHINFNNRRQYSNDSSILISVFRRVSIETITQTQLADGLTQVDGNRVGWRDNTNATFKQLFTSDGTLFSLTDSSVPIDTVFTRYTNEQNLTNVIGSINGLPEVTKTTDLPLLAMQPRVEVFNNLATANRQIRIRFMEVLNT